MYVLVIHVCIFMTEVSSMLNYAHCGVYSLITQTIIISFAFIIQFPRQIGLSFKLF